MRLKHRLMIGLAPLALFAGVALATIPQAQAAGYVNHTFEIVNSNGGNMLIFEATTRGIDVLNGRIRISGHCMSACLMTLTAKHVCVMPDVIFGYHLPYILVDGKHVFDDQVTRDYRSALTAEMIAEIDKRGGLKEEMQYIPWEDNKHLAKACNIPPEREAGENQ